MTATTLTLTRPDDWHLHLRDGELMRSVVTATARVFARAVVMPNLDPPITTVAAAAAYRERIAEFSLTQQDVADAVGRDRSTVANALRLLKLPAAVLALLHDGGLSVGHARALLALDDARVATSLAKEAVDAGLSVRDIEDRVRGGRAPVRRPRLKRGQGQAPEVRRIEDALRRRLGTDVRVTLRAKGKGQLHV